MDVLGDAVARDRRSEKPALRSLGDSVDRTYDYRRFCTSAWKVGNFLRHHGVRAGAGVGIVDDPHPEAVLSLYGAALLGGVVRFDPSSGDLKALVAPVDRLEAYGFTEGTKRIAYGARHEDPSVAYFERDVWSENPTEPPDRVDTDDLLLATGTYSHREVLAAAAEIVDRWGLTTGEEVAVRGPLSEPGVVAAGLVAPIVAGAVVVFPGSGTVHDYAVGDGPESSVDPVDVL